MKQTLLAGAAGLAFMAGVLLVRAATSPYRDFLRASPPIVDNTGMPHGVFMAVRPIEIIADLESGAAAPVGDFLDCEQQTRVRAILAADGNASQVSQTLLQCHKPERIYVVRGFLFAH